MKVYRTRRGILIETRDRFYSLDRSWDQLINRQGLFRYLQALTSTSPSLSPRPAVEVADSEAAAWLKDTLVPAASQEVWAAGVTYLRSRDARMDESKEAGGSDFYDKVYAAERPELFFKAQPYRVAAHGEPVYIRRDSAWNVPEPELTLFINSQGHIQAYTIGNDMSSRSIEGENPLYLPQAKVYERSAALGPCLFVPEAPIDPGTFIRMNICRTGTTIYAGEVAISQIKRSLSGLASWLYRETDFVFGCFLMTGTCLVPPNDFTLLEGDIVEIQIDGIGKLVNPVCYKPVKPTS